MTTYILRDKPIAYLSEIKALVITDLHIGYEYELRDKGLNIPSQVENFVSILTEAKEKTDAKKLILLGDIKHKVPRSREKEITEVKNFLESLKKVFQRVIICKGNHDDRIEYVVPEGVKVFDSRGFIHKNFGFFHGHAWPYSKLWNAKTWITGHLQPLVEIYKGGRKVIERVIIKGKPRIRKGKLDNILILPSFNDFLGGFVLNRSTQKIDNFLLDKVLDLKNSFVYLLDGTEIGVVEETIKLLK